MGTRIIKSLFSIISKMIVPFQRCFKKSSSEKCLLNKVPECPITLSTRVPKCPSCARVSQVLMYSSAQVASALSSQLLKCPLSVQVPQVFECLSALSALVPLECPLSALRVLKCPLSDHRVPFQCPNPL